MTRKQKFLTKLKLIIELALFVISVSATIILKIKESDDAVFFLVLLDAVLAAKLIDDVREIAKKTGVPTSRRIRSFLRAVFKPIISRFPDKHDLGKKYLSGDSETKIVFNFGIKDKIRSIFDKRVRVNPKKGKNNSEKVRLMYIKKILEISSRKGDIPESLTPEEASRLLERGESKALFSTYEHVRYEKDFAVSDETIRSLGAE